MKLHENICLISHCEEIRLLVDRMTLFCAEHSKRFYYFLSRYKVDSELDNMLDCDKEFQEEFFTDIIYNFCDEEEKEHHRKNKKVLKKKKPKKNKKKKRKEIK